MCVTTLIYVFLTTKQLFINVWLSQNCGVDENSPVTVDIHYVSFFAIHRWNLTSSDVLECSISTVCRLTVCWRVAALTPEVLVSNCSCGRKALHSLPFILLSQPGKTLTCVSGSVCFRYNVCVDRHSAFFSWLSVEQSLTLEPQLPYLVTPDRRYITNRWTWHLFRHHLRQLQLSLLLCKEEL